MVLIISYSVFAEPTMEETFKFLKTKLSRCSVKGYSSERESGVFAKNFNLSYQTDDMCNAVLTKDVGSFDKDGELFDCNSITSWFAWSDIDKNSIEVIDMSIEADWDYIRGNGKYSVIIYTKGEEELIQDVEKDSDGDESNGTTCATLFYISSKADADKVARVIKHMITLCEDADPFSDF